MTLSEAIQKYEAIKKRIKSAKQGLGSNKPGTYTDPRHHAYGKQRKRRAAWALKLDEAMRDFEEFVKDAPFYEVSPAINARVCGEDTTETEHNTWKEGVGDADGA